MSLFSRRVPDKPKQAPTPTTSENPPEGPHDMPALDVLGNVLYTLGRVSFDLNDEGSESLRKTFERWAQHVLVGAPLDPEAEHPTESNRRDWAGIRRFVQTHRKREVGYVVKALEDLRQAVSLFVSAFSRVVGDDGRGDVVVRGQLARLEEAVKENNTAAITREALATVQVVNESIERRAERHRQKVGELAAHVRKLSDQLQQAERAGQTDALTKIPNRACFDEFLTQAIDFAIFSSAETYLMMVDVDHFKQTNDTFGHAGGDAALKAVADRLSRCFPRRGDLVARYGGDEFAVVVRDVRANDAGMLAERLVVAMRGGPVEHMGKMITLSVSVGIAPRRDGDTADTWISRADAALYQAKVQGRGRWVDGTD